jgi:hypothetical protein
LEADLHLEADLTKAQILEAILHAEADSRCSIFLEAVFGGRFILEAVFIF